MTIQKTMVSYDAETHLVDTIELDARVWLVPLWLETEGEGMRTPLRMIPLARLHHQPLAQISEATYLVTSPLPRALFDPSPLALPMMRQYGVVEHPSISVRNDEAPK